VCVCVCVCMCVCVCICVIVCVCEYACAFVKSQRMIAHSLRAGGLSSDAELSTAVAAPCPDGTI
jgi:hypothetical protein